MLLLIHGLSQELEISGDGGDRRILWGLKFSIHSFFFIRTSNFDAEAERSYIFWRFEAETFLKMFLNLPGIVFQPISADVTRQTIKEHFLLKSFWNNYE